MPLIRADRRRHTATVVRFKRVLDRSPTRVRILDELDDEGPLRKHELRGRLDGTRTTVQRNLDALREREWIETGHREYAITPGGETIAEKFADLAETIQIERRLRPFLKYVDRSDLDIDLQLLADAKLMTSEPGDPWAMINEHVRVIERTEYDRNVLPVIGLHGYETGHEKIVNGTARAELVVTPEIAETLRSNPNYAELTEEMVATGRFGVYVYDASIPYFLSILDDTVQMGVTDDGRPQALLETDSGEVREWAEEKYEWYEQRAEKIL